MTSKKSALGTALVTGAAKRIGKAVALHLASLGYDIALHYSSSQSEAKRTAEQIRQEGRDCELFCCDLADTYAVQHLIADACKAFPNLNLLINCASIFEKSTLKEDDVQALDRHYEINLRAPYILMGEFARRCKRGQIINFLDTHITQNKLTHVAYLLSKKALADLTQMAALELAPDIRVNGIAPGLILPPHGQKDRYLDRLAKSVPLKRKGSVKDITAAVQFLIENDFLTGQTIFADGGEHLI